MIRRLILLCLGLFLGACTTQSPTLTSTSFPNKTPFPSTTTTLIPSPIPSTATLMPALQTPSATAGPVICSPLEGVAITELPEMIFNPFSPPPLGSDDPHQGVDFADIDPVYGLALTGKPVQAVMGGKVATIINDRFPYGYAILLETPLDQVPTEWLESLQIPTPAPTRESHPSLTCPKMENHPNWNPEKRSLYLLYAHLNEPFTLQVEDQVVCGQRLNTIGNSGNSLNPHLHLELRVGPAGAVFESIAHYTGSASAHEMQSYCLWRVSETFQLIDPLLLFSKTP